MHVRKNEFAFDIFKDFGLTSKYEIEQELYNCYYS
jgi:hypothetical protein